MSNFLRTIKRANATASPNYLNRKARKKCYEDAEEAIFRANEQKEQGHLEQAKLTLLFAGARTRLNRVRAMIGNKLSSWMPPARTA